MISPIIQANYQARFAAIGQQAKGLEKLGNPQLSAAFLENAVTDTVSTFNVSPDNVAYTKMVGSVSKGLANFPEVQKSLWQTAFQVVSGGVPGAAGVALAKSLEALGDIPAEARGIASTEALYAMTVGQGQTLVGESVHANVAFAASAGPSVSQEHRDLILSNTVSTIATLEDWNIR